MGENMANFSPDESLSLFQLSLFRTELCRLKAGTSYCSLGERCQYSHCLSWHRRNPFLFPYRPLLCPNTRFWTESKRMKVKTWCRRGRHCMFAHTKEEQMYHPLVYKTQVCRDWPGCNKPFCPFAHGLSELRDPDSFPLGSMEGPEIVEESIRDLVGEDKIRQDFERKFREREVNEKVLRNLKETLKKKVKAFEIFIFVFRQDASMVIGSVSNDILSTEELYNENFHHQIPRYEKWLEILCDGLVAIPLLQFGGLDGSQTSATSRSSPLSNSSCSSSSLLLESRAGLEEVNKHVDYKNHPPLPGSHDSSCTAPFLRHSSPAEDNSLELYDDNYLALMLAGESQTRSAGGDQASLQFDYLLDNQLLSFITKD
eukprot:Gregarina_sp_Poly_1__9405@NODE_588_length_7367_cov_108_309726_g454_i0_p3_GENE_NODE_588_length_7367_cov_108_309726_g454_i0NODE_588_length_7367_cov_108_309726_g454_i0_p3_ORF_typecomplete_len371_score41_92zfCCCH/PF00642_24/0_014zfCCCH/PF00642_24/1_2zfCCCH/PF00642_24/40zfCCCH_3/PF15663_5/2_2zfCCCH_3/PF15663_5/0_015zfCCCH_2/PF14608_6/14zfCCCH_2/PF14608_6/4_5zfCCCH_2/PF14608_6/0_15TFIIA/PF03153_13/0_12DUF3363/PF11843_8/0_29Torus/PF16131_5/24Torus/PF16131_5/18Torus/PF16131_5/8_1e03_NODE_588_length_7367